MAGKMVVGLKSHHPPYHLAAIWFFVVVGRLTNYRELGCDKINWKAP
ncbi:MAG: hypothetical protein U0V64_14645 [Cyclobacteriaceae bacterium]